MQKCYKACANYSLPWDDNNCKDWSDEEGCTVEEEGSDEEAYLCASEGYEVGTQNPIKRVKIPRDWVCDTYPQCPRKQKSMLACLWQKNLR